MVLMVGLEPTRPFELGILSPVRLPFRHTSIISKEMTKLLEVPPGFEPGNKGFADLCLTAWRWYQILFVSSLLRAFLNISHKDLFVKLILTFLCRTINLYANLLLSCLAFSINNFYLI